MTVIITLETRPRISSGVVPCMSVVNAIIITPMNAPETRLAAKACR